MIIVTINNFMYIHHVLIKVSNISKIARRISSNNYVTGVEDMKQI